MKKFYFSLIIIGMLISFSACSEDEMYAFSIINTTIIMLIKYLSTIIWIVVLSMERRKWRNEYFLRTLNHRYYDNLQ